MNRFKSVTFAVIFAVSFSAVPAFAGFCKWNSAPSLLAFGQYSVFATADDPAVATFNFRCTPNQYARLLISTGGSGVYSPSRLMSGPASAQYNIYLAAAVGPIWGDSTTTSTVTYDAYNSTAQDKDFIDSMYGYMPFGQDLPIGSYSDMVVATLQYSNNPTGPWNSVAPVSISVTANVINECRIDSFNLDFGNYNPLAPSALNQSTLLKVYCTKGGAPLSLFLDNGANAAGTQKRMAAPSGFLNYDATIGSTSGTSTSSLVPINGGFSLAGTIAAGLDVAVDSYKDTLVANVNY
jgi:spore coat protein U domain-containing protein, fimbrial subunit CupE1/2/3/6